MKGFIRITGLAIIAVIGLSSTCSAPDAGTKVEDGNAVISEKKGGSGIDFKKMTLEEAKELAKKKNQLVFVDAYTSWCGPCKQMAATTFKDAEVGELFNEKFINIKIEMEKDPEGPAVAMKYRVRAYPTLLFIDGDGNLVKSIVGFQTKDRLLALAQTVI